MPCCDTKHCFEDAIDPGVPRGERRCLKHASKSQRKRVEALAAGPTPAPKRKPRAKAATPAAQPLKRASRRIKQAPAEVRA